MNPFDEDCLSINSFDDSDKDPDFILKCKCDNYFTEELFLFIYYI